MKVVIEEAFLKKATPYMLRNDGVLLECGDSHPYIYYIKQNKVKNEIDSLLTNERGEFLKWFYLNTNNYIREIINRLVSGILSSNYLELNATTIQYLKNNFNVYDLPNGSAFDIESEFKLLDHETNQMFCRVRTSDIRWGGDSKDIYFRISSTRFNWFNIIWQVVYDNKNFIETVSICTDGQSRGFVDWYNYKGEPTYQIPIEEFITMSGNPVMESTVPCIRQLQLGKSLQEATQFTHPAHICNVYNDLIKDYIEEGFMRVGDNK